MCITIYGGKNCSLALQLTLYAQSSKSGKLKQQLIDNSYDVSTQIIEASTFWEAEERHQKYCEVKGFSPKNYFQERF